MKKTIIKKFKTNYDTLFDLLDGYVTRKKLFESLKEIKKENNVFIEQKFDSENLIIINEIYKVESCDSK